MANKTLDQLTQKTGKIADTDKFHVRGANDQHMEFPDLYKQTGLHAYGSLGALITQFQSENIFRDGDRVNLLGFYGAGDRGGSPIYWDASEDKANHNGVTIIDPTHSVTPGSSGWWSDENTGTGCFKRDVDALNIEMAGAKGNYDPDVGSGNNDSDAFIAAFSVGVPITLDPTSNYYVDSNISSGINYALVDKVSLIGFGGESNIYTDARIDFTNDEKIGSTVTISSDVTPKDHAITLSSIPSGVGPGDLMIVKSDALWYYDNRGTLTKGGTYCVESIDGNNVTLKTPADDFYDVSEETLTVDFYKKISLNIQNVNIRLRDGSLATVDGPCAVRRFSGVYFRDAYFENALNRGLRLEECFDVLYDGGGVNLHLDDSYAGGLGYGIQTRGCTSLKFINLSLLNFRRGVDFSGDFPTRRALVTNCEVTSTVYSGASGLGTHGTADIISFIGNQITTSDNGIRIRGGNTIAIGNTFSQCGACFYISSGNKLVAHDNTIVDTVNSLSDSTNYNILPERFILISDLDTQTDVDGPFVLSAKNNSGFIKGNFILEQDIGSYDVSYKCTGNDITVHPDSASVINRFFYTNKSGRILKNCTFKNNHVLNKGSESYSYPFFPGSVDIEFETTEVDQMILPTDKIQKHTGSGSITGVESDVVLSCDRRRITLSGVITFDVDTDTASIKIGEFPVVSLGRDIFYEFIGTAGTSKHVAIFRRLGESLTDYLHVGADDSSTTSEFAVGNNYQISIECTLVINSSTSIS